MQEKMTFVLTSCGRTDLLDKTREFFIHNTFKFEELFLVEDSVDENVYSHVRKTGAKN